MSHVRWSGSCIRRLLVVGAIAVIRFARQASAGKNWAGGLLERKPAWLVSVALGNKTAWIAWAVPARNQSYTAPAVRQLFPSAGRRTPAERRRRVVRGDDGPVEPGIG